jgi:hypothetical protein
VSKIWPAPSNRPQRHLLPSADPALTRNPLYLLVFRVKYAWRNAWRDQGKSRETPLWNPRSTACGDRWSAERVEERTVERCAGILGQ